MLTIKQIRDDKQAAIRKLAKKGVDAAPVIARIETLDDRRKAIQTELDNTLAAQNKAAKEIGALMGQSRAVFPLLRPHRLRGRSSGGGPSDG